MSIKSELEALFSADGKLYVEVVQTWARENKHSELNKELEWDSEIGAEQHRFTQIRRLIKMHIISEKRDPEVVSLTIDRVQGGGYRRMSDVLQSRDLTNVMLLDALADLERLQRKYRKLTQLAGIWQEVAIFRKSLDDEKRPD